MKSTIKELSHVITGMKAAYARGENAMAWARANSTMDDRAVSALIAYDLQAGTYVENARNNPAYIDSWAAQMADLLDPYIAASDRIMEAGVGEATTLTGVIKAITAQGISAYGFDLSWSRISVAQKWMDEKSVKARLFVGDIFSIPLADSSIDVVYTSHSLEPNLGKEKIAIKELLRVARKAVVLVEPCYELASKEAQQRMRTHGYVRGLKEAAESLGANVADYRLLDVCDRPLLNPSGVIVLTKSAASYARYEDPTRIWKCPLTGSPLTEKEDYFYADTAGIAYPVLQSVPLLRPEHAVIASKLSLSTK
jgi:hypothetical protein